ncbi:zinc finger BED domain-containing protein 4-like [Homalodisca vitripennis]|nr:zinc finger BED domain-containing protein 4-like [Homalodisca vitripennis]
MLKSCDDRFPNLEKSKTLRLCTFLDPRYKHHMFLEESTTIEIKKDLCDLLVGVINQKRNEQNPEDLSDNEVEPDQETESTEKKISVWDDVEEIIAKVKPKSNPTSMAIQEIQKYMDDSPISRKKDPLEWWKCHKNIYPHLATVFIRSCGIVATSVPCERMFSKAGYFISDRRTRLTTKKVNELMFLNTNLK